MTARALLVAVLGLVLALPASAAYRNPTAGSALALQIPGMHRAQVTRGVAYRHIGRRVLRMDLYRPRGAPRSRQLPVVLIGGPSLTGAGRLSGQKVGWGQLVAASGLAAAVFDIRSDNYLRTPAAPSADVAAAIGFLRARGARLGVDAGRMCTLGFSLGTAPWHLHAAMRQPLPFMRCNAVYYGALDFRELAERYGRDPRALEPFEAAGYLRERGASIPPMLIAQAGADDPAINNSIDRFLTAARSAGAPVELLTHRGGGHGFDVDSHTARSRAIVRRTLAFFRERLLVPALASAPARRPRPLRLLETCVTRAERRQVVRFRAADGIRLIGVLLGRGPRAVVLAHQGGGGGADLCVWMPYARRLVTSGYRVLAFDHRGHGSSGQARVNSRLTRVDFDVLGAIRVLRGRGAIGIVLAGGSLGGAAVIGAAAQATPPVQGVISFAAPTSFGLVDALAFARTLRVPSLYLSGDHDEGFPEFARALYEATPAGDKRLWIFPGYAHGAPVLRDPAVRQTVDAWIRDHLTLR